MKKCVRVAAQREDVMKAIKTLDNDRVLLSGSAFGEDSFSFKMRTKTHNRMYGSVRVSGRVKQERAITRMNPIDTADHFTEIMCAAKRPPMTTP